jgi:D-beta-D-heptose 7-phosphate kinase/D-beta-D-heptose 1-phosphate adenosyltransferase
MNPIKTQIKHYVETVQQFSDVRVLVIGDVMLDAYLSCKAIGIADDAPVPLLEILGQSNTLGGAANVARNLAQLGVKTSLVGVIGKDANGTLTKKLLKDSKVNFFPVESEKPTTLKTRVMAEDHYYLRFDEENRSCINSTDGKFLTSLIKNQVDKVDLIVISDYDKGIFSPTVVSQIEQIAQSNHLKILADLKPKNIFHWKTLDLITPNVNEAILIQELFNSGKRPNIEGLTIIKNLRTLLKCNIVLKMDRDGMLIAPLTGSVQHLDAFCQSPKDTSGAGDTVLSTLAAAIGQGSNIEQAGWLANLAASISVSKPGTYAVSCSELVKAVLQSEKLPLAD